MTRCLDKTGLGPSPTVDRLRHTLDPPLSGERFQLEHKGKQGTPVSDAAINTIKGAPHAVRRGVKHKHADGRVHVEMVSSAKCQQMRRAANHLQHTLWSAESCYGSPFASRGCDSANVEHNEATGGNFWRRGGSGLA